MQTSVVQHKVSESLSQVFIGRQPILNCELEVVGYELLFRSGEQNAFNEIDGNKATSQVINNLLIEIGLDELIGDSLAYINFTKDLLINGLAELLPADRVVLEVLEDMDIDATLINSIKRLVDSGYCIALDDFSYSEEWLPLIECTQIIKFDITMHSLEEIQEQQKKFSGRDIKFLAERVETQEEFDQFKQAGFHYFQGYFFSKPVVLNQKALSSNNISLLQLLSKLQSPEVKVEEIEEIISHDVSLSYKLFRSVNSAAFGLRNKLTSIKQAVVFFGLQRLKNWVSLVVMASNPDKPIELIHTGLVRARMCELIAEEIKATEKGSYFVVGLFSILEAVFDQSMESILGKMPLDESINRALLEHEGEMGKALVCSINCEQCHWEGIAFPKIENHRLHSFYLDAMIWARQSLSEFKQD